MPKRTDIKSVMVIGSGPIVIGQAAEFDYSGTQACRVLREEGIRVILVNSNPATIMTDPEMADATYIEPIATPILEQIIAKERPDALLPTLGGQTALNAAMALGEAGVLEKYNVELIGASLEAIDRGEDRELFKKVVDEAGAESARSDIAHSIEEVDKIAEKFGYPLVVRPSFTMGGLGSGIAHNEEELHRIAGAGIHYSPTDEVLIEEGIEGWKEFELELMRDRNDNVVVVCPIENVDPVGVHTGDSITVAPCFTLTDREYQKLRDIGIAIIRGVGVDTGGCNIQFAVHPDTGRIIVIEMNPRVSRSSALASKATGFPIAKIATKLALGYTLDEIRNDITQSTPASFEPTIDYVVTKVPRFAFEKFPGADPTLTTSMKSVGEAMALAGNFQESLGKAMRSIDKRHMGFNWDGEKPSAEEVAELLETIHTPTEHRYLQLMRAIWGGATLEQVFAATKIDPWFLKQIFLINETAMTVREAETLTPKLLKKAKLAGLSDVQVAHLRGLGDEGENTIRELRWTYGLRPVYKTVDTCAAEFDAATPYYYSCYADETELRPREREAVIILGSGPNRIGQGLEDVLAVDVTGHQAHGDARDRSLQRNACGEQGQRGGAHGTHGGGTVGTDSLGDLTDGVRELLAARQHRHESLLGEGAMADLTALRRTDATGLAGGIRRHLIVVHVTLGLRTGQCVDLLLHLEHVQGGDAQNLGLATLEQGGTVHARHDVHLGGQGADVTQATAVDAVILGQDTTAHDLALQLLEGVADLLVLLGVVHVGELFREGGLDAFLDLVDAILTRQLLGDGQSLIEIGVRDLVNTVVQVLGVLREELEFLGFLRGDLLELGLGLADHLDERLGGFETTGDDFLVRLGLAFVVDEVPGVLAGTGFDHGDGDVTVLDDAAGDHDFEHGALTLAPTREGDPLAVDQSQTHTGDRAFERQAGNHGGGGGRVQCDDVIGIIRIDGEHGFDDLHLIAQGVREQRTQRTVDDAAGENGLGARAALTAEERARDLAGGIHLLFHVDGQREEVVVLLRAGTGGGGRQNHRIIIKIGGDGTIRLLGETTGLEAQRALAE